MKRFYKNTLISRVCDQTLRVVALLCVLLGVSSSAWGATTIYFENTLGWENVYVCSGAYWKDDNDGVVTAGKNAYKMEYMATNNDGNKIYSYTYTQTITEKNIVFIADNQGNWNQLNNTSACFRGDFDSSSPLFKPNTKKTKRVHDTDYYNDGNWYGTPCFPTETIYFVNNLGWQNVYAYLYSAEYWNDTKGTGSKSIKNDVTTYSAALVERVSTATVETEYDLTKVTSAEQLVDGTKVIFAAGGYVMGEQNGDLREVIYSPQYTDSRAQVVTLVKNGENWKLQVSENKYLI